MLFFFLNEFVHLGVKIGKDKGQKRRRGKCNTDFNFVLKLAAALKVSRVNKKNTSSISRVYSGTQKKRVEPRDMKCNFHFSHKIDSQNECEWVCVCRSVFMDLNEHRKV